MELKWKDIDWLSSSDYFGLQLEGELVETIGNLTRLTKLFVLQPDLKFGILYYFRCMWHNRLSGAIPHTIGQLTSLQVL